MDLSSESDLAEVICDTGGDLSTRSEMEVCSLLYTTEQAIQMFMKEDCESNLQLINSLEEISFNLWLEANCAFLQESSLWEESEGESDFWLWDEDCFISDTCRSSPADAAITYAGTRSDSEGQDQQTSDYVSGSATSDSDSERDDSSSSLASSVDVSCARDRSETMSGYLASCEYDMSPRQCETASCQTGTQPRKAGRRSPSARLTFCESMKLKARERTRSGDHHREDDWVIIEQNVSQRDYDRDWLMISSRFSDCNTFSSLHSNAPSSCRTLKSFDTESFTHSDDSGIRSPGILHSTAISCNGLREFGRLSRFESSVEYASVFETPDSSGLLSEHSCVQDRLSQLGMAKDWLVISLCQGMKCRQCSVIS